MFRRLLCCLALFLGAAAVQAEEAAEQGDQLLPGMSIVGNDEAPKSLVIVPWKSADPGDALDVSRLLTDAPQPVDRDVFMRELDYYQIRAGSRSRSSLARQ